MKQPNPKLHQQISFVKSAFRILGYAALLFEPISAVILLVCSETLGVVEELVWTKDYYTSVQSGVNLAKH